MKRDPKTSPFTHSALLKALAIVNIFETSRPLGDAAAVALLDDGAGISYGISQFTHRSGALAAVMTAYLEKGGEVGRSVIEESLPLARKRTALAIKTLAADERLKKALRAAGLSGEMRAAQREVAFDRYLRPAVEACNAMGFVEPLSLTVVYDSITHGSWEKIAERVGVTTSGERVERDWIARYVKTRDAWLARIPRLVATRYRTRFFLNQIRISNWDLELPLNVNGVRLREVPIDPAADAGDLPSVPQCDGREARSVDQASFILQTRPAEAAAPSVTSAQPPEANSSDCLDRIEEQVDAAAAKYDQVERIATTVRTRNDAAKSLWTTVVGSLSQTFWALFGLAAGIPREVWLVVAVIAAALMLLYLYRQIALGKIREKTIVSGL